MFIAPEAREILEKLRDEQRKYDEKRMVPSEPKYCPHCGKLMDEWSLYK